MAALERGIILSAGNRSCLKQTSPKKDRLGTESGTQAYSRMAGTYKMSNTNQTVVNAIQAVNEERQAVVVAKGKSLIGYIEAEAATIARLREDIKLHQEEIEKIAHTVIDFKSVTGRPAPATPNVNEATIIKVITKLNEDKQKSVEVVAQKLADAVTQKQASIKATEQRIADLRKQLSELQAEVVTTTTVLGS